ncbi:MAG: hypothetical protein IPK78_20255 [Rhodospirillales bacterium]|nr:hypothetical protein [Rhodospirillales bacterium]
MADESALDRRQAACGLSPICFSYAEARPPFSLPYRPPVNSASTAQRQEEDSMMLDVLVVAGVIAAFAAAVAYALVCERL